MILPQLHIRSCAAAAGLACALSLAAPLCATNRDSTPPLPDEIRVQRMLDARWGLFLHWSLGTFSNQEWTQGITDPAFFAPPRADTDQWCETARAAGMGYIILVAKHHDGFCLWDTDTTEFKVTRSPLGRDVVADLRRSCDRHGLKLALYYSEADWTWPNLEHAEMKARQITELFTRYGEIALVWMDTAQWDGGLGHEETAALVRRLQPNCFIGFNHGLPAGDLQAREMGALTPLQNGSQPPLPAGRISELLAENKRHVLNLDWPAAARIERELNDHYHGYKLAECATCINQKDGKWYWFYNVETADNAIGADEILAMHDQAVANRVLLSLALGPDRTGRLRPVDVERLRAVGAALEARRSDPRP